MGRVRNFKLDKEADFHDDLSFMRQKMIEKKTEFINFTIECKLDSFRSQIESLGHRVKTLEKKIERHKIKIIATEKCSSTKYLSLFGMFTAIMVFYYKYH